jgi:antitoxin VapB
MEEFDIKQNRIQQLLDENKLDALVLQRVSNFAWATCGAASYINIASTTGEAKLVITKTDKYLVTNNIEAVRLKQEEKLEGQGWEFLISPWYESEDEISKLTSGLKIGTDHPSKDFLDVSEPLARIRVNLTSSEGERFRKLSQLCAEAMNNAAHRIRPGQTEFEIAGVLAGEAEKGGVQVVINLVAADERVSEFRHPLPTGKKLDKYAMLVLCGRKEGLICSITRFIHFGPLPKDLRIKAESVAKVDAEMIASTRPGKKVGEIFQIAKDQYAAAGYPDEWQLHHQGGPVGYEPREFIVTPDHKGIVEVGQAYAWNPSITGTKSEDTFLVGENENEILTEIEGWPYYTVEVNGRIYQRPAILEIP